jgi:uncharacterized membrane protein YdbT with pleckstrin-like domain
MPISFTRYEVDETRFTSRIGFFSTVTNETLLYRIMDLKLSRTLGQKIFGVGTITLFTADKSHSTFELKNIKKAEKVYVAILATLLRRNVRNAGSRGVNSSALPATAVMICLILMEMDTPVNDPAALSS